MGEQELLERTGLRQTLRYGGFADRLTGIVIRVALPSQCVEHDPHVVVHAEAERQRLNHRLLMAWLVSGRAIARGEQCNQRTLHHRLVRGIEARLIADVGDRGVGQIALDCGEQPLHLGRVGIVRFQAADLQQVL